MIVIRGTPEGAQKAELMIRKVIADQPVILTEVVHVPQTAVGRIIGIILIAIIYVLTEVVHVPQTAVGRIIGIILIAIIYVLRWSTCPRQPWDES